MVEPVFLLTCGSWLNWIGSEFAVLRHFALNGTDHRGRDEQDAAIGADIRRHTPAPSQGRTGPRRVARPSTLFWCAI